MSSELVFQWGSIAVLAILLYFPVSNVVWVMSVRRLQRKRDGELTEAEIAGQLSRARFIAAVVVSVFSYLFYINVVQKIYG